MAGAPASSVAKTPALPAVGMTSTLLESRFARQRRHVLGALRDSSGSRRRSTGARSSRCSIFTVASCWAAICATTASCPVAANSEVTPSEKTRAAPAIVPCTNVRRSISCLVSSERSRSLDSTVPSPSARRHSRRRAPPEGASRGGIRMGADPAVRRPRHCRGKSPSRGRVNRGSTIRLRASGCGREAQRGHYARRAQPSARDSELRWPSEHA